MKPTLVLFFGLFNYCILNAQDFSFSQFYNFRASLNPAYISVPTGTQLVLAHRRQWGLIQQGLNLTEADFSTRICRFRLFTGLKVAQASEPLFGYKVSEGAFRIAGFKKFRENSSLHLGAESSLSRRTVDFNNLVFSGQLDPVFGIYHPTTFTPPSGFEPSQTVTAGGGALFRSELKGRKLDFPISIGLAVRNAWGNSNISFLNSEHRIQRFWTAHASFTIPLSEKYRNRTVGYLTPVVRYDISGQLHRGIGGVIFQMGQFMAGPMLGFQRKPVDGKALNTRHLAMLLAYRIPVGATETVAVSYQIEGAMSGLGANAGMAHEIVLAFDFPKSCFLGRKGKCPTCKCPELGGKGFWGG